MAVARHIYFVPSLQAIVQRLNAAPDAATATSAHTRARARPPATAMMSALRSTVASLFGSGGADSSVVAHCASPSHLVFATSAPPSLMVFPLSRTRPAPARSLALSAPLVSMAVLDSVVVASLVSDELLLIDAATLACSLHGGFAAGHVAVPRRDLVLLGNTDALVFIGVPAMHVLKRISVGVTGIPCALPALTLVATPTGLCRVNLEHMYIAHANLIPGASLVAHAASTVAWVRADDLSLHVAPLGPVDACPSHSAVETAAGEPALGCVESSASLQSGRMVVNDVDRTKDRTIPPGNVNRQLVFADTDPDSIQSECLLVNGQPFASHLVFLLHRSMVFAARCSEQPQPRALAVIGLGCGALLSFLHAQYPGAMAHGVDLDPEVIALGKRLFGLAPDGPGLRVHVAEGLAWLRAYAHDDAANPKLDLCFIDVDAKAPDDALFFPPADFISLETLVFMRDSVLAPRTGMLVCNVASRHQGARTEALKRFARVFRDVACVRASECNDPQHVIVFAWGGSPPRRGNDASRPAQVFAHVMRQCPVELHELVDAVDASGTQFRPPSHGEVPTYALAEPLHLCLSADGASGLLAVDVPERGGEVWVFDATGVRATFEVDDHEELLAAYFIGAGRAIAVCASGKCVVLWLNDAWAVRYEAAAMARHPRVGAQSWLAPLASAPAVWAELLECMAEGG